MNAAATDDRAPLLAGVAVALAMAGVAGFWALFALIGGNGFNGDAGLAWLGGNIGAGVLAWIVAPLWAARRCAAWRRSGWSAAAAIAASALLAVGFAMLALFGVAVAMAGVTGWMR